MEPRKTVGIDEPREIFEKEKLKLGFFISF
jgi:hypothetical protein